MKLQDNTIILFKSVSNKILLMVRPKIYQKKVFDKVLCDEAFTIASNLRDDKYQWAIALVLCFFRDTITNTGAGLVSEN